jgi:phosphatidate cytidylyltransferase
MSTPPDTKKKSGLTQRVITAIVAVPILLWVILVGAPWIWLAIIVCATAVALYEFYDMTIGPEDLPTAAMGIAVGTLLVPTIYFVPNGYVVVAALSTAALALLLTGLFSFGSMDKAAPALTAGLAGILYVALFMSFFALLRRDPGEEGRYWILMLLSVVWAGDTGAYFSGRFLGRYKLAPVVSPKKTWEGAIGGAAASVGAGFIVWAVTPMDYHPLLILALTLPAAVLAQLGDLCESLLKRSCGVKDSGMIIYGHGGILDRIDGLLFAGVYVYFFYRFALSGGNPLTG